MNRKSYADGYEKQADGTYSKPAKGTVPGYIDLPAPEMKHAPLTPRAENILNTAVALMAQIYGMKELKLVISGQIKGGKNNITVTRSGKRFPNKQWAAWRDAAVREIKSQLPAQWKAIEAPVNVRLDYIAGDRRRRDFPAICDAVWHVMEKAGVVTDDTLLWPAESTRSYSKNHPRCEITFRK